MSFFNEPKTFGLAMFVVGILSVIASIVSVVLYDNVPASFVIATIGSVIYGLMIAGMGIKVKSGDISGNIAILGSFVSLVGAGYFITALFSGVGLIVASSIGVGIIAIIIGIIIAFILIFISKKITDGVSTSLDKIIWILLLLIFAVLIIFNLITGFGNLFHGGAYSIIAGLANLCYVIVYAFLLFAVLSDDVKNEMGI